MELFLTALRAPFLIIFCLLYTGFMSAVGIPIFLFSRSRALQLKHIRLWARGLVWVSGLRMHVHGLQNLPAGGSILVFNHTSHFDIPVLHAALPKDFRFGAKTELFRIPIFGSSMRTAGALEIARADRQRTIGVYRASISRVQNGESFILAPEGTRQHHGLLGDFKSGPFVLGIEAQVPIVPIVLGGMKDVLSKKSIWINLGKLRRDVVVQVLPPVSTEGLRVADREQLKCRVREQMHHAFEKIRTATSRLDQGSIAAASDPIQHPTE